MKCSDASWAATHTRSLDFARDDKGFGFVLHLESHFHRVRGQRTVDISTPTDADADRTLHAMALHEPRARSGFHAYLADASDQVVGDGFARGQSDHFNGAGLIVGTQD